MHIKNKNSFLIYTGALLVGLILLNLTARDIFHRFDLTDNKMFSLSPSSRSIVEQLDDRLTMKVYFSENLPNELGNTRRYLQDILEEYRAVSDNISFYFYNPETDKDLEEEARKDGIQPVQMQVIENDNVEIKKVYLGMVLLFENKKEVLPVIQTTSGLEYMISTKIKSLINLDKKTIGLIHLDPANGSKTENISTQLSQHYNFRALDLNADIPPNIDVLLVTAAVDSIDPKTIEKLNGFLESGKKIFLAQSGIQTDLQTQQATPIESNIFDFLNQYNLNLQKNLVLDSKCGNVSVQQRQGIFLMNRPMEYPFFPVIDSFNSEEVVVSDLEQVLTFFSSEIMIDTVGRENISKTVSLFKSSNNSGLMEQNFMLSPDPQQNPFIQMFGQEGKTLAASSELKTGGEIMLVSDSKFFVDEGGMSAQINLVFLMNAVDYLAGDEDLIALRSREITSRPLRELEDSTKKKWKYANMLLPSFLIIGFGVMRMRKEKHQADILKQIYD
jgi:ABC-type uncharacterized transport system involved in gliding motility auxiliary subunit